jgi:nickel superoxide dismutase
MSGEYSNYGLSGMADMAKSWRTEEDIMKKISALMVVTVFIGLFTVSFVFAHCEIPCGIYDDKARITLMNEHITTIEKSMRQISERSGQTPIEYNQLVRWISNKENHANELQHIVTQYFMTQRIKFDAKDYEKKLTVLHKILVHAMKAKQTTDLEHISTLRSLVSDFETLYFGHSHKK